MLRSRTGSRLRHKYLSFPKQWESLDPLATKGHVCSCMRQPLRLWCRLNATDAGGWWTPSWGGRCKGISRPWASSAPRVSVRRRTLLWMAGPNHCWDPQRKMMDGPWAHRRRVCCTKWPNVLVGLPRPERQRVLNWTQGSTLPLRQMYARCRSGWQPRLTHLPESGGDDTTRRIYAGVDAKRSSATPSVRSGSTPLRSPEPSPTWWPTIPLIGASWRGNAQFVGRGAAPWRRSLTFRHHAQGIR